MNGDVTAAGFRDFMEWGGTTGRKSDTNVNLLLNSASDFLEKQTGRLITATGSNVTRTFTTNGRAYLDIPDLRGVGSLTLQGAAQTLDSTFWLAPSRQDPTVFVGVQLRAFGQGSFLANPDWFDRNLDQQWYQYGALGTSLPNDLAIASTQWGWAATPSQWIVAIYAMAGYMYQHADALFSGARATPEGNIFDLSTLPSEVQALVSDWTIGDQVGVA